MSFVSRRTVRSASGRPRRVSAAGAAACLIAATLTLGGAPAAWAADTTAPVWGSVSVSPTSVDTSAGTATVVVTARITDDHAGIREGLDGYGHLEFGMAPTTQSASVIFAAADRISGTATDGVYQSTLTLGRYAARGTWSIISSSVWDSAGNSRSTSNASESAAAGLTASVSQTGAGDSTAPTVTAITLNPATIDTSAASQPVTMRVHVTDDLSGVEAGEGWASEPIKVDVAGPSGTHPKRFFFHPSNRVSGTARNGVYESTAMFVRYTATGTWRVSSIWTIDSVGNSRTVEGADVAAAGLDASFTQTGAGDITPPTLSEVVVNPAEVNPALSSQYVTVRGRITDDLSGLTGTGVDTDDGYARITFQSDDSPTMQTNVVFTARQRVSGTHTDGIYETVMGIPKGWTGLFTVTKVQATDYKGNHRTTTGSELGPVSIRTVDTVLVPSAPTKVRVTPGNGSLTVSWAPPLSDGGAARTGYQITASGGASGILGCNGMHGEMPPVGQTNSCDITVTAVPSATSATITGLTNGRTYTVRVTASNSAGWGPPSDPVSAIPGTPSAPWGVKATAGDASATVLWSAPADNGGAAVTSYTVTAYVGSTPAKTVVVDAPATSVVVDGLTNGTAYRFSVAATNAAGTGAASTMSASVTPKASSSTSTTTTSTTTTTTTSTTTTTTAPKPTTTTTTTTTAPGPPTSTTTSTTAPPVQVVPASARSGYWMVSAEGRVYAFGDARHHGEPRSALGNAEAVDLEPTKSGNGYWVLDDAGRVYPYGDARWSGNVNPVRLVAGERATSLSRTVSGAGYWVFTNQGRVLTFGDAVSYGDVALLPLNGPVLDSIVTPSGQGYYMVASDGGIFAFGDAKFHGSMGATNLNAPVQSLVPDNDGEGYWLVASDGGIFAFKAPFRGSLGGQRLNRPISGMVPNGSGYLMVGEDGGIFNFSDRPFFGSLGANPPARPVVAAAVLGA